MIEKKIGSNRRQIGKGYQVLCGASTVLLFCFLLAVAGCGGGNNNITTAGPANATINTGDATNDQVLAFELTINSLTLTGKDSSGNSINPSVLSHPTDVEFSHEAGTFEPLSLANLPAGTYSGATVGVANPEVVAVVSGVPTKLTATLSASTVTVTFPSPITITSSNSTVINFDLDLANSLTISGTSATVNPQFNVTTSTVNMSNEDNNDGEIEDVHGTVTAVAASATPPTFSINTASGASITFQVNSSTHFDGDGGFSSLSQLVVGAIVEVDGITQSDGSKLATKVEAEENEGSGGEEAEGIITGISGTPPADALTVAAQLASMSGSSPSVAGNTFTINTTSNTQFVVRADKLNLSSPPAFDATNIGKGQRIEADIKSGNVSNNASVNADSVKLREQAVIGTIAATPAPTSTSFTVTISPTSVFGTISGTTSIPVTIVSGTEVKSGTSLAAGSPIRVRGLIFFNATGSTYSMIAARIDSNN